MQDDHIDFENSHPDMEKIIGSDKLLPVTRSVAKMLMRNPYTSLGKFFKKLSNENLEVLMEIIDEGDSEFNERMEDIVLMTEMLSRAEGVPSESIEEITENVNYFGACVTCVSLARKGLVRVYYENMSFGTDHGEKVLVERL
jgi:phosphoribosyl-ATP pyrophosphohydrolase